MYNNSRGFTLIELIIVIIILGVLSVTAVPKFININTDARITTLETLEGAMRSASSMVNLKARIENKTDCSTDPTVEVEGEDIRLRCGYPCPHPKGIGSIVNADGFTFVGGNCGGVLGNINVRLDSAPDPDKCRITYAAARGVNQPPSYVTTTTGC